MLSADTIAAIATARGRAALAIVRVSGPEAISIAGAAFAGADLTAASSHTAHVGYVESAQGERVDQVVALVFRAPRSSTGEDVVEFTCHGGDVAPHLVLQALLDRGARMAEPGAFSQRAFLNGKLDLAQAEAVADLIHASSSLAHRVSLAHLQGRYSDLLADLRADLLDLAAHVELELDFSEEDVAFADRSRLDETLGRAHGLIATLLESYALGALIREGVRVVIGGRPNAGKSTLLNALVGRSRAIVSATPGTTRDEVEAEAELEGLLYRFVDTAGLRETADEIEAEGVRRAQRSIETSDVLLYVYDVRHGLGADERAFLARLRRDAPRLPLVLVANKADLVPAPPAPDLDGIPFVALSAEEARRDGTRLVPLTTLLRDLVAADLRSAEASPVVTNQRHRAHLVRARAAVEAAQAGLRDEVTGDLLALDLRTALHELGAITGAITNEDVLGEIFSRFCIGK